MKTTFFVDIDQTISTGHVGRNLAGSVQYYRERGVVVPCSVTSWPELFQLPDVMRQHEVLPGARAGVRRLAAYSDVIYVTIRAPDAEQITRDWLAREDFPSSERLVICQSIAHKLLALAEYTGPLILVDDR